ncbi:hypothetical protein FRC02_003615, partial [Tulasnella sp. 418]
ELKGHSGDVESLAFSKDYSQVASGSNNGVLYIWDVAAGSIEKVMKKHDASIRSIAFSHDSLLIASGSDDHTIVTWNAITGLPVKALTHDKSITDLAFSHDSLQIASATSNKCIYLWDTTHGTLLRTLQGMHDLDVRTVLFSPDKRHIISASNSICIWDMDAKDFTRPFIGHTAAISAIALSHDSTLIATGSDDHTVCIWTIQTGFFKRLSGIHTAPINIVDISANNLVVLSGSKDHTLCIWESQTGTLITILDQQYNGAASFSHDGLIIASGHLDKTICIWDVASGSLIRKLGEDSTNPAGASHIAFSPDSSLIASISYSSSSGLHIWDVAAGSHLKVLHEQDEQDGIFKFFWHEVLQAVAFSFDNRSVAARIPADEYGLRKDSICWSLDTCSKTEYPGAEHLDWDQRIPWASYHQLCIGGQWVFTNGSNSVPLCHLPSSFISASVRQVNRQVVAYAVGQDLYILDFSWLVEQFLE